MTENERNPTAFSHEVDLLYFAPLEKNDEAWISKNTKIPNLTDTLLSAIFEDTDVIDSNSCTTENTPLAYFDKDPENIFNMGFDFSLKSSTKTVPSQSSSSSVHIKEQLKRVQNNQEIDTEKTLLFKHST